MQERLARIVATGIVVLALGLPAQVVAASFGERTPLDVTDQETALQQPAPLGERPFVITARQLSFEPAFPTVPVGTTIAWVNRDRELHTVTSDLGLFDLEVEPGASASMTFTEPGVYFYFCQPHDWMIGEITVEEVSSASP
jgi:plastocyanin